MIQNTGVTLFLHLKKLVTILSTKKLTAAQQELLLNTGLGLVHYNALSVVFLPVPAATVFSRALIITSKNAIHALTHLDKSQHVLYCVGDKTAQQLQTVGFKIAHIAQSSRELAQHLVTTQEIGTGYTYVCGMHRRDELPALFCAQKIPFNEVKVYRTVMVKRHYRRTFAAVLCYSPRGVLAFAKANPKPTSCAICIGETTAKTARLFFKKVVVATQPTVENTLITAYKALQHD